MDVEIKESVCQEDVSSLDRADLGESLNLGTIKPLLQNICVRGASLFRLQFWNRCLIGSSVALGIAQAIVSVLVIIAYSPEEDWPERYFWSMDIWFPEIFGAVIGVILGIVCRGLLKNIAEATMNSHKAIGYQQYQRYYIPWKGVPVISRKNTLSLIIVPTLLSFPLFVVSAISFSLGIRMLTSPELAGEDANVSKDHSSFIICLCVHFFILLIKIGILVLQLAIPVLIATIANVRYPVISNHFYPFALFLNRVEFSKPLLIEL